MVNSYFPFVVSAVLVVITSVIIRLFKGKPRAVVIYSLAAYLVFSAVLCILYFYHSNIDPPTFTTEQSQLTWLWHRFLALYLYKPIINLLPWGFAATVCFSAVSAFLYKYDLKISRTKSSVKILDGALMIFLALLILCAAERYTSFIPRVSSYGLKTFWTEYKQYEGAMINSIHNYYYTAQNDINVYAYPTTKSEILFTYEEGAKISSEDLYSKFLPRNIRGWFAATDAYKLDRAYYYQKKGYVRGVDITSAFFHGQKPQELNFFARMNMLWIDYAAWLAGTEDGDPANVSINYSYITYPLELWILGAVSVLAILVCTAFHINKRKRIM